MTEARGVLPTSKRHSRIAAIALTILAVCNCRGDNGSKTKPPTEAPAVAVATSQSEDSVRITFDGEEVARVSASQLTSRLGLVDLLPREHRDIAGWIAVEALSKDGRRLTIPEPSTRYQDHEAYLYRGEDGKPALGWFLDAATREGQTPTPRLKLIAAAEIRILTKAPVAAPGPLLELAVGDDTPLRSLDSAAIAALPVYEPESDGGDGGRSKKAATHRERGRKLRDVVGLAIDPKTIESITIYGEADSQRTLPGSDLLKADGSAVVIKTNRRGLRMVRWSGEDGKRQEVRGASRLEVSLKKKPAP